MVLSCEFLTNIASPHDGIFDAGEWLHPGRDDPMEYEIDRSRAWQLASLILTAAVVGGALAFALAT